MQWADIKHGSEDPVFRLKRLYDECNDPRKVCAVIGAYRDNDDKPVVLDAVTRAKAELAALPPQKWTHEYLPIAGYAPFTVAAQDLIFGQELRTSLGDRLVSVQSMSGTGACRLACELLSSHNSSKVILIPDPTWVNHKAIALQSGLETKEYRYLDYSNPRTPMLDFKGLIEDLRAAPKGATVLLHMVAHNPTGVDPTKEQWEKIADVMRERELQPFFDSAYQGFASGDLDADAYSLRMFVSKGLCPIVACSFAKNMGLYGERCGAFHVVAPDADSAAAALSQVKIHARAMYSNPPQFGAQIAYKVMTNPELRKLWETELKGMAVRIRTMRETLRAKLEENAPEQTWHHVTDQIGMFCYTGLTKYQVEHCINKSALFMLSTGRISVAGVNERNVEHVANAIASATKERHALEKDPIQHVPGSMRIPRGTSLGMKDFTKVLSSVLRSPRSKKGKKSIKCPRDTSKGSNTTAATSCSSLSSPQA